jgi:ribonuclease P protein component
VAPGSGPARAAVVAGRRVGGAVARNRARRLLREAWRSVGSRARQGCDVVLVARPAIAGARAPQVAEEVREVLIRAGCVEA